jgi:hypothetical protein
MHGSPHHSAATPQNPTKCFAFFWAAVVVFLPFKNNRTTSFLHCPSRKNKKIPPSDGPIHHE